MSRKVEKKELLPDNIAFTGYIKLKLEKKTKNDWLQPSQHSNLHACKFTYCHARMFKWIIEIYAQKTGSIAKGNRTEPNSFYSKIATTT